MGAVTKTSISPAFNAFVAALRDAIAAAPPSLIDQSWFQKLLSKLQRH